MLRVHGKDAAGARRIESGAEAALPAQPVWIDLYGPSKEEEAVVEAALGIDVPTREEMQEIEASSRLYVEGGALFMTAPVVARADTERPVTAPITFILARGSLITVRYDDPQPFRLFWAKAERQPAACASGEAALAGLLDSIIDRIADILEKLSAEADAISQLVFRPRSAGAAADSGDLQEVIRRLGRVGDLGSRARESLVGIGRVLTFLASAGKEALGRDLRERLKTLSRDVASLSDQTTFISNNVNFLLSATMGLVNIEQNNIIKIVSVAATVFLPPTLIASIYGMNFEFMPELGWPFGYPIAMLLMVASAIGPYAYFRRRGWL
jgi:magnesium transporter